jgi:hypothetical protein
MDTTKNLQPTDKRHTIATCVDVQVLINQHHGPYIYKQALQRVFDNCDFQPIHHPKKSTGSKTKSTEPAVCIPMENSYKRKNTESEPDEESISLPRRWKCLGCGYTTCNQNILESHCSVNATTASCSSEGMCPIYQGRFGYASSLTLLDSPI